MILVGGGAALIDAEREIKGVSKLIMPEHYHVSRKSLKTKVFFV